MDCNAKGYVWQLRKAMYGTKKAAQAWQEYLAGVFSKKGWRRVGASAGVYYEPSLGLCENKESSQ